MSATNPYIRTLPRAPEKPAARIGIDLGGTKIEGVALAPDGIEAARLRVAAPSGNYASTLDALAELVGSLEEECGATDSRIGVGTPGWQDKGTGLITNANQTSLNGAALDKDLTECTGRPVRLMNDANCFALAEAMAGAAQAPDGADPATHTVFGAILGTGVGAGLVIGGQVIGGRNSTAGEWGHIPLPGANSAEVPGELCYCGQYGCVETWCSGPAMTRDHFRRTGTEMDARMIAEVAAMGDAEAAETIELHLSRLARALGMVVNLFDPDVIVLGGGLSNQSHLYDRLPEAMQPHVYARDFDTPIVRNALGDSAGVIGAAWLWPA